MDRGVSWITSPAFNFRKSSTFTLARPSTALTGALVSLMRSRSFPSALDRSRALRDRQPLLRRQLVDDRFQECVGQADRELPGRFLQPHSNVMTATVALLAAIWMNIGLDSLATSFGTNGTTLRQASCKLSSRADDDLFHHALLDVRQLAHERRHRNRGA